MNDGYLVLRALQPAVNEWTSTANHRPGSRKERPTLSSSVLSLSDSDELHLTHTSDPESISLSEDDNTLENEALKCINPRHIGHVLKRSITASMIHNCYECTEVHIPRSTKAQKNVYSLT